MLRPKPGFNPMLLNWAAPDQHIPDDCSYCGEPIPEDFVPLRMWNDDGWAVVFCDGCAERWFGMRSFPEEDGWIT